jgi:hypothetical protein
MARAAKAKDKETREPVPADRQEHDGARRGRGQAAAEFGAKHRR